MKQQPDFTTADFDDAMTALTTEIIDLGLTRGLLAAQFTTGLTVDPEAGYDVIRVAVQRAIELIPHTATVGEVLAVLRQQRDDAFYPEVH